jgi:hypothetical protein
MKRRPGSGWREMDKELESLDLLDQETQERWARFSTGCPFQDSDDGTCGHDDNLTPECTVWACPATIGDIIDAAVASECARCVEYI